MAQRGVNKVILVGTAGQDPELKKTGNGNSVVNLSLATSENWVDKQSGDKKERTEWHRVVLFGKVAEIAAEYVRKGNQVYIEGKLQTREWEKDGVKHYTTEIVVEFGGVLQLLGGRNNQEGGTQPQSQPQSQGNNPAPQGDAPGAPDDSFGDGDDIPFGVN